MLFTLADQLGYIQNKQHALTDGSDQILKTWHLFSQGKIHAGITDSVHCDLFHLDFRTSIQTRIYFQLYFIKEKVWFKAWEKELWKAWSWKEKYLFKCEDEQHWWYSLSS